MAYNPPVHPGPLIVPLNLTPKETELFKENYLFINKKVSVIGVREMSNSMFPKNKDALITLKKRQPFFLAS